MRLRFNVQIVPALIRIDDEASLRRAPARGLHALPIVFASQLALKQLVGLCCGACISLHLGGIAKAHCVSGGERLWGRKARKLPYRLPRLLRFQIPSRAVERVARRAFPHHVEQENGRKSRRANGWHIVASE